MAGVAGVLVDGAGALAGGLHQLAVDEQVGEGGAADEQQLTAVADEVGDLHRDLLLGPCTDDFVRAVGGQPKHWATAFAGAEFEGHRLVTRDGNLRRLAATVGRGQFHAVRVDHAGMPSLTGLAGEQRRGVQADRKRRPASGRITRDQRPRLAVAGPAHVAIGMALVGTTAHIAGIDHVGLAGLGPLVDRDEGLPFVGRDRSRRQVPFAEQGAAAVVHEHVVGPIARQVRREGHLAAGVADDPVRHDVGDREPRTVGGVAPHPPEVHIAVGRRLRAAGELGPVAVEPIVARQEPDRVRVVQPRRRMPRPVRRVDEDAF